MPLSYQYKKSYKVDFFLMAERWNPCLLGNYKTLNLKKRIPKMYISSYFRDLHERQQGGPDWCQHELHQEAPPHEHRRRVLLPWPPPSPDRYPDTQLYKLRIKYKLIRLDGWLTVHSALCSIKKSTIVIRAGEPESEPGVLAPWSRSRLKKKQEPEPLKN